MASEYRPQASVFDSLMHYSTIASIAVREMGLLWRPRDRSATGPLNNVVTTWLCINWNEP